MSLIDYLRGLTSVDLVIEGVFLGAVVWILWQVVSIKKQNRRI